MTCHQVHLVQDDEPDDLHNCDGASEVDFKLMQVREQVYRPKNCHDNQINDYESKKYCLQQHGLLKLPLYIHLLALNEAIGAGWRCCGNNIFSHK